jgi:hypothetical protein
MLEKILDLQIGKINMRHLFYFTLFLLLSCSTQKQSMRALGETRCLRTVLIPTADTGGDWTVVSQPELSLPLTLSGDNPCIDLSLYGCGEYIFKYTVESTTCDSCVDESTHIINYSLTLVGTSSCY